MHVLNRTTPACLPLEQPHESPVAGDSGKLSWTEGGWARWVWSLMLGLSSPCQTHQGKGWRNLEAVVWVLLHPPCPLSDSDPLALLLHSAVAGVSSSGEGGGLHPSHSGTSCFKDASHDFCRWVPLPPLLVSPSDSQQHPCLTKIRTTEWWYHLPNLILDQEAHFIPKEIMQEWTQQTWVAQTPHVQKKGLSLALTLVWLTGEKSMTREVYPNSAIYGECLFLPRRVSSE